MGEGLSSTTTATAAAEWWLNRRELGEVCELGGDGIGLISMGVKKGLFLHAKSVLKGNGKWKMEGLVLWFKFVSGFFFSFVN